MATCSCSLEPGTGTQCMTHVWQTMLVDQMTGCIFSVTGLITNAASQGGSPSSTASQPPKADKTWWGRFRSFKHVRPALPQGLVPVWQITWVVYVSGRRYSICFQLDQEHRLARLLVNDFEIMRKSYNLVERVREPFLASLPSIIEPLSGLCLHTHLPPAPAG